MKRLGSCLNTDINLVASRQLDNAYTSRIDATAPYTCT